MVVAERSMHKETMKIALHVIVAAGYGYQLEWDASSEIPAGHKMSFRDSIRVTLDNLVTLVVVPRFLLNLPIRRLQNTNRAYKEFGKYLQGVVELGRRRGNDKSSGSTTIIGELLAHSLKSSKTSKDRVLSDDEVAGNAFVLLLAGHETT